MCGFAYNLGYVELTRASCFTPILLFYFITAGCSSQRKTNMKLNDFTFICMCRTGLDNSEAANIFGLKVVWVGSIDCRTTRRRSYIEGEEVVLDLWWWG